MLQVGGLLPDDRVERGAPAVPTAAAETVGAERSAAPTPAASAGETHARSRAEAAAPGALEHRPASSSSEGTAPAARAPVAPRPPLLPHASGPLAAASAAAPLLLRGRAWASASPSHPEARAAVPSAEAGARAHAAPKAVAGRLLLPAADVLDVLRGRSERRANTKPLRAFASPPSPHQSAGGCFPARQRVGNPKPPDSRV